ncbi:TonB-dependent siderophore receptor [Luteibacter aegosomaticola]|uniref:TonB-dependent receptor n=1 Tax=Luteibacter aegosomaticola TaxID=2911538 RepID=UPI001FF8F5A0|nr:TonB-dependent siderophore receptor [Luteibacter aegosomaticola]UPG90833.1 TonB-dependent siderophore receptor [Luteibacter aegosomaticola]
MPQERIRRNPISFALFVALASTGASAQDTVNLAPVAVHGVSTVSESDRVNGPDQKPSLGKTDTKLEDLPASVQVIPRALLSEQGATMLRDAVSNASGVNSGGQDSKGYYDHFLIRGLNAQVYSDGFSDGDQLSGLSHSLNGVERIEILEGPGSALFGSGPPGGTINVVHYTPSSILHYGGSLQAGTYGALNGSAYITGPTGVNGLDYRIDATASHTDGFRKLSGRSREVRPAFRWQWGNHVTDLAFDLRHIHESPDSYGLIYFNGTPIRDVSRNAKYSSPFADAHSDFFRTTLSDQWTVSDLLTINNRFSFLHRTLDAVVNGDSSSTKVTDGQVVNRQLREQDDKDRSIDYQFEPVWRFNTGSVHHTLLTGFEYQQQKLSSNRQTADLPNIPDAFSPVPPESSLDQVHFLCDAKHSCDDDRLGARYYSAYATDQIDVTDALKVRAGVRQDWWHTSLTPLITVPGRFGTDARPLLAGVEDARHDAPVSWNIGALYKLLPWMSPYVGISRSHLTNFNSENTQNGVGEPESALQYEAGIKFAWLDDRVVLNVATFDVKRDHVATATTLDGVEAVVFDSQKTRGEEASADVAVTEQWHLLANVTHQNAYITDNPQGIASVGHRPQGAPDVLANLWTTYSFRIADVPGFRVGAGVNYQDKTYSDITNANSIPSFAVVNMLVGFDQPGWGIDVNVHNVTDRRYIIAANGAGGFVGEPRSAFVNLHASF